MPITRCSCCSQPPPLRVTQLLLLLPPQTTQERQTATIVRLERELEEAKRKLDESSAEVQAAHNSHRGEIKKMQDLLKMMQEQLEALQASRSGPVPTKARFIINTHFQCCSILRRRARASAAICLPCSCVTTSFHRWWL